MKNLTPSTLWSQLKRRLQLAARGDTVVEVMVSMTVLAVVVAAAYSISTKSFQSSLDSQYRDQAVSYDQQQLELIKEADNNIPSTIGNYTKNAGTPFCIDASTKNKLPPSSPKCKVNNLYKLTDVYDSTTLTFVITTQWSSLNNHQQESVVFYKPNDSFNGTVLKCTPTTCAGGQNQTPAVNMNATPSQFPPGGSTTIYWSEINVKAGSCKANGPFGFDNVDVSQSTGSWGPQQINGPGSYTFSINCTDNSGSAVAGSTSLQVIAPTPVVQTSTPNPISYNSATLNGSVNPNGYATTYQFNYGTNPSYGSSTPSTAAGAGTTASPVSAAISGLQPTTPYHFQLCATNSYGKTCSPDASFVTAVKPPPTNPPTVVTGGASHEHPPGVSDSSKWDLSGTVNPNGGNSTCYFLWDNDSDLTRGEQTTYCSLPSGGIGSGTAVVNVGTTIDLDWYYRGGENGVTFYYQLCAYNSAGTSCGLVKSFVGT